MRILLILLLLTSFSLQAKGTFIYKVQCSNYVNNKQPSLAKGVELCEQSMMNTCTGNIQRAINRGDLKSRGQAKLLRINIYKDPKYPFKDEKLIKGKAECWHLSK